MGQAFSKYIGKQFYNELFRPINNYIMQNKGIIRISKTIIEDISYIELDDFDIRRILSIKASKFGLTLVLQVVTSLEVKGSGHYGYETDYGEFWLNVSVCFTLDDGIKNFKVLKVEDTDAKLPIDSDYKDNFVPIISSNQMEAIAESILEIHQPDMLKSPHKTKYKEYDIHPKIKGNPRGEERLVIGDDGSVWFTKDHYKTFIRIK